jgi:hypothetical protein
VRLEYAYSGRSAIVNQLDRSQVAFATNNLREVTYFRGELARPLVFREALAALYDVVVSDYKYRPKDRFEFRAWLEEQDRIFLQSLGVKSDKVRLRMAELEARKAELDACRLARLRPFHAARRRYFEYAYTNQYELDLLLDPVITVHPDELSFEAFSRDESSYARLAASYDLFSHVDSFECGTTNVDFSTRLHDQLERMRSYRHTRLDLDPSGFSVASDGAVHREKKIDLPDSWVMGFLQVHSVMSMSLTRLQLTPVDLFNICRQLRRRRARTSPRALRWELIPGHPTRVVLEPWEQVIELDPVSRWQGDKPLTVRTWGRDRLQVLARLLPVARSVELFLAGFGLPSILVLDLGELSFTLGLSGWTDNDWTGDQSKFELLTRKQTVTAEQLDKVYQALRQQRRADAGSLAVTTGLDIETVRSALGSLCQVGRAMYDLGGAVYRHRELFVEPFSPSAAAVAATAAEQKAPQAAAGKQIFSQGQVHITARRPVTDGFKLTGSARGASGGRVRPLLHIDHDGKIITASCTCRTYKKLKLTKGPCDHILALRLAHMDRLRAEKGEAS